MKRIILLLLGFTMIIFIFTTLSPNVYNMAKLDEFMLEVTRVEITNDNGDKLILGEKKAQELFNYFAPQRIEKNRYLLDNNLRNTIEFFIGMKKVLEIQTINPQEFDNNLQVMINNEMYSVSNKFYEEIKQLAMENRFRLSQ